MLFAGVGVLLNALELVDHGYDQASTVALQQVAKLRARVGTRNGDVLLLHFTQQPIYPPTQLPLKLCTIHHYDDRRRAELRLALQNQTCRSEQGKCLS